ncbi:glycosyltransferase [Photobacterium angustum]|uniref:Glycosyltransferase 2-like domain-containing protein n=1 Tax=Photobacterium angustum TaxID=661 RepID=A0A2S7VVY1_PHOAN|nr:glycosyltransferase [Photobacterium angustum]PQJ66270.1 hypothetical protein BTO08_01970 [Photobacterium angustum]
MSDNSKLMFTVGLSIYDGVSRNQLERCINSIINQTFQNFELIIYLDGVKKNDLIEFIDDISDNKKINIIRSTENKGLAVGLNSIIKNMNGDFLVRMDADDESKLHRLEVINDFFLFNQDVDILGSAVEQKNLEIKSSESVDIFYPEYHKEIVKQFKYRNPISHPTVVFRKRVFDLVPSYPIISDRNEDTLMWLSAIKSGFVFHNLKDVLYIFNYNEETEKRRVGFKKSFSDYIDRIRVQLDLGCSFKDCLLSLSLFVLSVTPLYKAIRKKYFESVSSKKENI